MKKTVDKKNKQTINGNQSDQGSYPIGSNAGEKYGELMYKI